MFVLWYRVYTHVRLRILQQAFVIILVLLYRVCAPIILVILATSLYAYPVDVFEGNSIRETQHCGDGCLSLCLCCCRVYLH